MQGENKHRTYEDAYNARIDDRKELLHKYRSPTNSNINLGPDPELVNVQLKTDDNRCRGPTVGYTVNNNLDRLKTYSTTKFNDNIVSDRFMDPVLLKQLESNPFNIPIYSNQN